MTKSTLRVVCACFTLAPVAFAVDASTVAAALQQAEPPISPIVANRVFPLAAAYFFAMPFLLDRVIHRPTSRVRLRGGNPDESSLLTGVASSCGVGATSFVLVLLAGVSTQHIYVYATLSLVASLFWCWRYGYLLR